MLKFTSSKLAQTETASNGDSEFVSNVSRAEPRALNVLGKHSATQLYHNLEIL